MTKDPSSALLSGVALDTVTMGNASGKYDDVKFSYNVAEDQTLPTNDAMLTVQAAVVNHEEEH